MVRRIAIVNRGEAAMRLIHAVRELNAARGLGPAGLAGATGGPIETIALYTDVERGATFVREADHAYCLGPASARPYLDHAVLARALVETGADAAWVGWGFVAEDPAFVELCEKHGITFIGPSAEAMRKLGDKIGAKLIAEEVGVPVAPWSRGAVDDLDAARRAADEIGYPLMLKATAGGGGRGIRVVRSAAELAEAYERTRLEAQRAFGSGVVFLERLVTGARHVEVQVIADGHGTAWALGVRDCSVQRRNQKIIEESASPLLDAQQVLDLKAAAERLAIAVDYRGAGTVEFLYHPGERLFAFLEVNTRLQVEHPITEVTTDVDLVKAQLEVAAGGRLGPSVPAEVGHAVEARLNAEDPDSDFAPSPGRIVRLVLPSGPGIRVDTGVSEGDLIPADFDSMIAKIIAYGRTRAEALARLRRAVAETTVLIEGGATNKSFLLELLDQPAVLDGSADTGWIDRVRAQGGLITAKHSGIALAAAAIEAYEAEAFVERHRLLSTAHGGRPQAQHESGRPIELKLRGATYRVRVAQIGPSRFRVGIEPSFAVDAEVERIDEHTRLLRINGRRFRLVTDTHGPIHLVEVDGVTHRVGRDEGGVVRSPAPALVVATPLQVGDEIEAGAPVLVLESMKMETVLRAPVRAVVRECLVAVGSQVSTGAPLLRLEPIGEAERDTGGAAQAQTVDLQLPPEPTDLSAQQRVARGLADLRSLLLGYDVDPGDESRVLSDYLAARNELPQRPIEAEVELLRVFADLAELSRNRPEGAESNAENRVHSPREYFHAYLQSLDVDRAGLPETFRTRLARVLAHYGVESFERTPALDEAVFRIFLAQQRTAADAAVIVTLLQQWLTEPLPAGGLREVVGQALEHLIFATQVRFPAVGDLARSVVFRWAAQPMLRRKRAEVYASVRGHLRFLDRNPTAPDRRERIAAMVASPEPLVRLLGQRIGTPGADHGPMLEVLSRRYYGNRGMTARCLDSPAPGAPQGSEDHGAGEPGGHSLFTAEYDRDGARFRLFAVATDIRDLPVALAEVAERKSSTADTVADVYLTWSDQPEPDAMAQTLRDIVDRAGLLTGLERITISVAGPTGTAMHHHFTFRSGLGEDRLIRGLHPLIAQRLQLPRLRHFDLTRLPSADEEVYVFHCVAPNNPADERLAAMAQVRDLTPLRDVDGRILALPAIENALAACLDAIRTVLAQHPAKKRFDTNRITIYVWPPNDLSIEELNSVTHRLLPLTAGAGLEEVLFLGRQRDQATGRLTAIAVRISYDAGMRLTITEPSVEPIQPLDDYRQKVLAARRRGATYPYELIETLAGPLGSFTEYDLAEENSRPARAVLVPVQRPKGHNRAGVVAGVVSTPTERYPEGVTRVVLLGDPTRSLGALAEPECVRVIAALDLAQELGVPVDWFALSSGARISMTSGTENMDWVAAALKRIVEFTQAGGEINVVVAGITVGAQPYWNAEATMLMHTKGILVMTPDSAMVLTGKQSLDFSGGVSAEDNFGIGGYDRVMGPNGQAQYWAPDLRAASNVLLAHHGYSYIAPGENHPRRAVTTDPLDRDVRDYPHAVPDSHFATVGEIFSKDHNPDRKKPFDIRTVMRAVADQDHAVLERWTGMADAETAVVQDVRLGGIAACLIGIESRSVPRRGFPPTDGPDTYTAGTLFPRSSKKVARAISAASGNRPLVVLANLSGFDGSPESMRLLQLEYGAEIGRAIVNFRGPIVFCVISRYHGGAFVVFSKALNRNMTVLAVEGSFASVIGGAPAAAVVFAADVNARTAKDTRVADLESRMRTATGAERAALVQRLLELRATVRAEKLGEVAAEFDAVHSIQRAVDVGSVDAIIRPEQLRPEIIAAIERGLADAG